MELFFQRHRLATSDWMFVMEGSQAMPTAASSRLPELGWEVLAAVDSAVDSTRHYPATQGVQFGRSRCPSTFCGFLSDFDIPPGMPDKREVCQSHSRAEVSESSRA
jgi:hypothetical protein